MSGEGVSFRFEVPTHVWAANGAEAERLIGVLARVKCGEVHPSDSLREDVTILRGRADRQVLAELGPLVEACWRPVSGDQEGTSG